MDSLNWSFPDEKNPTTKCVHEIKIWYYFLSFCWSLKSFSLSVLVNLCLKLLYILSLSTLICPLCFKLFQHLNFQPILNWNFYTHIRWVSVKIQKRSSFIRTNNFIEYLQNGIDSLCGDLVKPTGESRPNHISNHISRMKHWSARVI